MSKILDFSRPRGLQSSAAQQTDAEWSADNPTLKKGEIAYSTDLGQFKIGDGTTAWADLDYYASENQINESIGDQTLNAADTYVDGSLLVIPATGWKARASLRWRLWMTKTAAGVATPAYKIRVGTAGAIGDTARVTHAGPAQTGAADTGYLEIIALLRNTGASAVLSSLAKLSHNLLDTGFAVRPTPCEAVVSSAFSSVVSGTKVGLSIDPGANGVWTVKTCIAELINT